MAEGRVELRADTAARLALLKEEKGIQSRLAATHNRLNELHGGSQPPVTDLAERLRQEERRLEELADGLRARMRLEFPQYAEIEYPEPLMLRQVQEKILDDRTLLLEYSVSSEIFVWAIRKDAFEMLPVKLSERGRGQTCRFGGWPL